MGTPDSISDENCLVKTIKLLSLIFVLGLISLFP
jgi:hypothetical protein